MRTSPRRFYALWFRIAFSGAINGTSLVAFLASSGVEVAKHFAPRSQDVLNSWLWAIPFWGLLVVVGVRLVWAPYLIWEADQVLVARKHLCAELTGFATEANELLQRAMRPGDTALNNDVIGWFKRAQERLEVMDPTYLPRFLNSGHGAPSTQLIGAQSISVELATTIRNRILFLEALAQEVRRGPA